MAKHRRGLAEKALATRVRVDATTGCHIWTGSFINSGYGRLKSGDEVLAHRVAYTLARGPIPAGAVIDHLCRTRACVNPTHMEAVTNKVNVLRGQGVTAKANNATHCPQGHPYDASNTYIDPKGARRCRACSAGNWARHAAAVNANRRAKAKARSAPDEPSSYNHNEESQTNGS